MAIGQVLDDSRAHLGVAPAWTLAEQLGIVEASRSQARALRRAATHADGALAQRLGSLSRVAFSLRDRMSVDHWRTLNRLIADPALQREPALPMTLVWLDRAITSMMTLSGFVLDGMTRGIGWRFVSIGRRIERLSTLCSALQVAIDEGRTHELDWLLDLADSSVTYRSRYLAAPEWLPVLDMIVRDESNPRSLAFQAKGLADFIARLEATHGPFATSTLAPARAALAALTAGDLRPESEALADDDRAAAARRLRGVGRDLAQVLLARRAAQRPVARCVIAAASSAPCRMKDRYTVEHETRYAYRVPVSQSWQLAHLTPKDLAVAEGARPPARHRADARRAARGARRVRQRRHPLRDARRRIRCCAC